jgi:hypothetical protein
MSTQYNPKLTSRELLQERVYKLLSELSYEGYNYEEVLMLLHGAGMFAEHEMRANAETSLRVTKISADLAGLIVLDKNEFYDHNNEKKTKREVEELNKMMWDDKKKPN